MRLNSLEINFHRTIRVPEGRVASSLPPSLGRMKLYKVSDYKDNCPQDWAQDAYFGALHPSEAMWISFASSSAVAVLIGAGGVNALTAKKLGTTLEPDNYLVCPPQPWIDGWKGEDGSVHQFVATAHKKGDGLTVGEQLIGAESKTGAIGIALFEPKLDATLNPTFAPITVKSSFGGGGGLTGMMSFNSSPNKYPSVVMDSVVTNQTVNYSGPTHAPNPQMKASKGQPQAKGPSGSAVGGNSAGGNVVRCFTQNVEMGIGKGGAIAQKIYPDPHGIEVWQEKPSAVFAFYLVDAAVAKAITGETIHEPRTSEQYSGPWFDLEDSKLNDIPGSSQFAGLKSVAFPGDTSNVKTETTEEAPEPVSVEAKAGA